MHHKNVDILDLSADIFLYPDKFWFEKIDILSTFASIQTPCISLDELCSFHINAFELHSKKGKTTPFASYWINGLVMGKISEQIEQFYASCGYTYESFGPPDHISNMLSFCAILSQERRYKELKEFTKWLQWLSEYEKSLKTIHIKTYSQVLNLVQITLNKELENAKHLG